MIKRITLLFFLMIFNTLIAQKSEMVLDLIYKSGINEQLNEFDKLFKIKVQEQAKKITNKEQLNSFNKIMSKFYTYNSLKSNLNSYLKDNIPKDSLVKVLKLYDKPLIIKMRKLESDFLNPNNKAKINLFYQNINSMPLSDKRIDLVSRLNIALNSLDFSINLIENLSIGIARGANSLQSIENRLSDDDLIIKVKEKLPEGLNDKISYNLILSTLYIFQSVNEVELEKYVEIWESSLGDYFQDQLFEAYNYAFKNSIK
jgi:hypothetical protein